MVVIDQTVYYILENKKGAIMIPNKEEIVQMNYQYSNYEKFIIEVTLNKALDNCIFIRNILL